MINEQAYVNLEAVSNKNDPKECDQAAFWLALCKRANILLARDADIGTKYPNIKPYYDKYLETDSTQVEAAKVEKSIVSSGMYNLQAPLGYFMNSLYSHVSSVVRGY